MKANATGHWQHQEMAKDEKEEQLLKIWFDLVWDDFVQKVVKHHLPMFMPAVEQLWGGKVLPYPSLLLWSNQAHLISSAPVDLSHQGESIWTHLLRPAVTHTSASANMGSAGRPVDTQKDPLHASGITLDSNDCGQWFNRNLHIPDNRK